jgi:hypothetical protein
MASTMVLKALLLSIAAVSVLGKSWFRRHAGSIAFTIGL